MNKGLEYIGDYVRHLEEKNMELKENIKTFKFTIKTQQEQIDELIMKLDKVREYINNDENYEEGYCDGKLMIYKERLVYELLKILGDKDE